MPKILVTGGAGYIGSHTALLLRKHAYDVVVVDDLSRGHQHNVEGVPFHQVTLGHTDEVTRILKAEKPDAVIHFAAYIAVGESTKLPELYFTNNVSGTLSLLTAMMAAGVSRLVFSSTAAVYGDPDSVPIPENAAIRPVSPYGESKVIVERILGWMDMYRGLRSVVLRYFNACGADPDSPLGEEHDPETHLIPLLFRAIQTGKPVTIFGDDYPTADGTCIRDYVHVSDLAEAHVLAVKHLLDGGASDVYNAGTGTGQTVKEVIQAVEEVTGKKVPYILGPRRDGDAPSLVANSDRLKSALGWRPKYTAIKPIVETAWAFTQTQKPR